MLQISFARIDHEGKKNKINLKTMSFKEWGDNAFMDLLQPRLMAFLAFLVKCIKPTVLVLYTVH